ncbi:hypothetical protein FRC08_000687 [Ceratobasidium sp. 394]|nr:hypothetical protein FRC08_000687 [Ceratobasidium sp. 394]
MVLYIRLSGNPLGTDGKDRPNLSVRENHAPLANATRHACPVLYVLVLARPSILLTRPPPSACTLPAPVSHSLASARTLPRDILTVWRAQTRPQMPQLAVPTRPPLPLPARGWPPSLPSSAPARSCCRTLACRSLTRFGVPVPGAVALAPRPCTRERSLAQEYTAPSQNTIASSGTSEQPTVLVERQPGQEDADTLDEEPLTVNVKQYHRILRRRTARACLEGVHEFSKERKRLAMQTRG